LEIMNPVYSPGSSGVPYANAKGIGYPVGHPEVENIKHSHPDA
ncbi:hypothetical protein U0070_007117, partial [Myodes glareolus]